MCSVAIQKVLKDLRFAIDHGKFYPIDRFKNSQTLSSLGISWEDAKAEIYTLTAADYHCGPKVDRDRPESDHLWEFKKRINGDVIYIKFKILYQTNGSIRVISFHFDGG